VKIFLIGMMGSGKSYWKEMLAKQLKTGGYDLDFIIESQEERTISEIFDEEGEAFFSKKGIPIIALVWREKIICFSYWWRHSLFSSEYGLDE